MSDFGPGDIVEISSASGFAYVQVTHRHTSYPEVVRVLSGFREARSPEPATLAAEPTRFIAMIPLKSALARLGLDAEVVATTEIPEAERTFPTFRMPIRDKQGNIAYWWFWDGEGLTYDVELGEERERLPAREVMSAEQFMAALDEKD